MNLKAVIPNSITLANLVCGLIGIKLCFDGEMEKACYLIWIGVGFDFFDGFAARMLKVTTEIGKQLDSLSDLVSFGVLPGFIAYQLISEGVYASYAWISIIIPVLSALRLAKFNVDDGQKQDFIGITTTANGLLISSIPLIIMKQQFLENFFSNALLLMITIVIFSALLVSPLKLFSLKFQNASINTNWHRYFLLGFGLISLILFRESGIPLTIIGYLTLSLVWNTFYANKNMA